MSRFKIIDLWRLCDSVKLCGIFVKVSDLFQDTIRMLKDYYGGMEGKIPDEQQGDYIRIPLIEVLANLFYYHKELYMTRKKPLKLWS